MEWCCFQFHGQKSIDFYFTLKREKQITSVFSLLTLRRFFPIHVAIYPNTQTFAILPFHHHCSGHISERHQRIDEILACLLWLSFEGEGETKVIWEQIFEEHWNQPSSVLFHCSIPWRSHSSVTPSKLYVLFNHFEKNLRSL